MATQHANGHRMAISFVAVGRNAEVYVEDIVISCIWRRLLRSDEVGDLVRCRSGL